jgi:predicted RNA-binding protein YlxR (DUF448 family)
VVGLRRKHVPLRRCVVCGAQRPKAELVRIVRLPEGGLAIDAPPKEPGRGAYVCRAQTCLDQAAKGRAIHRSLERPVTEDESRRLRELAQGLPAGEPDAGS